MRIIVEFGKPYRGFGAADPRKSPKEREKELYAIMAMPDGQDLLVVLASQGESRLLIKIPPPGTIATQLIAEILDLEYSANNRIS